MSSNFESSVDGVIIISSDKVSPENIILNILNVEHLPTSVAHENIQEFEWKVDTKYYTAVVHLYLIKEKQELDPAFCKNIQATVLYFDGQEPSDFDNILSWMPILKNVNSEVQLLVCDTCKEESHKKNILDWCVKNEFELIELNPAEESDDEEETSFSKSKECSRVVEALQSHTWCNLVMKDESKQSHNSTKESIEVAKSNNESSDPIVSPEKEDSSKKMKVDGEELLLEEQWLQNVLEHDDPEGESLEALFAKFASMKDRASGLSGEERKKYAEKVAIAFWKAIEGDDDEIEGLDDE